MGTCVTESKLVLLPRQDSKLRDKLLGQGIATSFRKPADRKNGGLLSQRTVLTGLEFRLVFILKGGGGVANCYKLLAAGILSSYS